LTIAALCVAATFSLGVAPTAAQSIPPPLPPVKFVSIPQRAAIDPVLECADMMKLDLLMLKDAPTRINSAELEAKDGGARFCHVKGVIAPQIQFELHLPIKGYTGRYLQGGCGGACGAIYKTVTPACDNQRAFGGEFAVSFNNSGHVGPNLNDTLWAAFDPQLRIDFAYRANHVMATVAKEILAKYYGKKPDYSYFMGCSNGGREAMMEAQRYPDDFDGIVAGAPALWISLGVSRIIHESKIAQDDKGNPVLTPEATTLLHNAVLAACDGLDGLNDGQIDNPRLCHYDPRKLVCKPGKAKATDCITAQQADVMRQLYRGAVDDQGRQLFFGGEPYGSELIWTGPGSFLTMGHVLAANQIKFMIYGGETHQDFDWRTWKPGKDDVADLMKEGGYYNANNPDLSAFKAKGGKLIMWQGEADNAGGSYILPDYYQRVRDNMGGFAGTDPFLKVYLFPGMYHCFGGYVAYEHDLLGPIVNWVERGEAPNALIGTAILKDGTIRNRPTYSYPTQARYKGKGDINAADNFVAAPPKQVPDDHFDWVGADMIGDEPPKAH
jgi:feruloyl esterase